MSETIEKTVADFTGKKFFHFAPGAFYPGAGGLAFDAGHLHVCFEPSRRFHDDFIKKTLRKQHVR